MDADHFLGYIEDEARALYRDDFYCQTVREEQDGTYRKLGGPTIVFCGHFLIRCLALCVAATTCVADAQ